jgi:hypothetical protein
MKKGLRASQYWEDEKERCITMADERYSLGYTKGKEDAGRETYNDNQINGKIIGSHGSSAPEYDLRFVGTKEGHPIWLMKEKKIDLHNNDLTTGFLSSDMIIWEFCSADYLSKVKNMEKILGVDLTRHYNRWATTMIFMYALSKGGGNAAKTAKKQYIESSSYEAQSISDMTQKAGGFGGAISGFFSKLPKPKGELKP